jgi:cytochrome c biogenesis protein CcmG/thiol:disulfide interchange protein DsbE
VTTHRFRALWMALSVLAPVLVAARLVAASDEVGQPVPALIVKQLDGRDLDLAALRGKVVVLNFWATWCPLCRAEMPMLEVFHQKHESEGVTVIGVSTDDPHERKAVSRAMQGLTYPAALLVDAKPNGFAPPQALPITYIIGPDGIIRARLLPTKKSLTEQDLATAVTPLLPQDAGSTRQTE